MLPRFDPALVKPALVSLRKRDLSEETLDALGVDITYLQRGKFDPATLTDLMKEIDRRKIDVLHLHGYGATTFGRLAAKFTRLPVVLHEHANLTATPWFQQVADRLLAGTTDIALAVSESTADFVRGPRKMAPERVKVVYLGAPLEEFSRAAQRRRDRRDPAGAGPVAGRLRRRHRDAAARLEGQRVPGRGGARRHRRPAAGPLRPGRRGAAARRPEGPGARPRARRSVPLPRLPRATPRRCCRPST